MKDEILEELWKAKDQIACETNGNSRALFEHLREVETKSSHKIVNRTDLRKKQHA